MNFASPWSFPTEAQASPAPSSSQQQPPQQPSPSIPTNPGGGGGNSEGSGGGAILGDIKTSPTEKDVLKDAAQYVEDEKLVDRILPIILSKIDKRQLASTVLPYLDLQISIRVGEGEKKTAEGDTLLNIVTKRSCAAEEILISGGFQTSGASIYYNTVANGQWNTYASHNPIDNPSSTSSVVETYPLFKS